ncbi:hypothetical protein ACHAW6_000460 [Cyclotella cf. meneghiniana]
MTFIRKCDIPQDRLKNVTFGKIVVVERPHKQEKERTRLTGVGTHIDYPWNKATPTSDLTTAKLLFNSVISTPRSTFHSANLKNFYLNTPVDRPEYMKLKLNLIPTEIVQKHNLQKLKDNGWIYIRINLGMYGLPQAGILANKLLAKRLSEAGYYQCQFTPGLW